MNQESAPLYDAETQALIRQLAETQIALQARLGSEVDRVVDPASGRVLSWGNTGPADRERRRAEAAQREQERLLEENRSQRAFLEPLMEAMPAAIGVIGAADYRYQYMNLQERSLLGMSAEQIVGRTIAEVWPDTVARRAMEEIDRIRRSGEMSRQREVHLPAGPDRPEMYMNIDRVPLRGGDGQVDRVLIVAVDVTEQVQARRQIEELARFPGENPHPVLRVSREGRILYANHPGQIILAVWDRRVGQVLPEEWRSAIVNVLDSGSTREREITDKDRVYALSLVPVPTAGYVNVYGRDITERKRAEEALREREERLQLALKATNDVVWDWDIVHDAQRWNEAGTAVFGWVDIVAEPQTAAWWVDRVHPDDRQRVADGFHAAVADRAQSRWQDEYRFRKADGSYALVLDRGYIKRDEQGRALRMIGAMLDITARKQAEEALRDSEARFRAAVQNPALVLAQTDRELRYRWIVNPHPDFDPAGVIGKRDDELGDSEDTKHLAALKQQVLEGGVGIREEISFQRSDGMHTYDMVIEPLRNPSGEIVGVTTASLDVTQRQQAEAALLRERQLLQTIYDTIPVMLTIYDPDLQQIVISKHVERVIGWTAEDAAQTSIMELAYPDPAYRQEMAAYMQSLQPGFRDITMATKDGGTVETSWANAALPDGRQVGIGIDIRERKRAEEALRESEERARATAEELEAVLDSTPVAVWIAHDRECRQITGNSYADEMIMQTARGSNVSRSAAPGEAALSYRVYRDGIELQPEELPAQIAAATGRAVPSSELELSFPNGRTLHLLEGAVPLFDAQGNVRGAVAAGVDITERKQAEEALRRYARRLDVLHEIDHAILAAVTEGEVIDAVLSRAARLLPCHGADVISYDLAAREMVPLGLSGASEAVLAVGRRQPFPEAWLPFMEQLSGGAEYVLADVQALSPAGPALARYQATGTRAVMMEPVWMYDQWLGTLNLSFAVPEPLPPEYVEIARELAIVLSIGIQQARLHAQVRQHARELERRVRARTRELSQRTVALEASEARFRAVFEEAAIGIALVDRKGHLLSSNPALQEMLGYSVEALEGMPLAGLLAPGAEEQGEDRLRALLAGGDSYYALEQRFARQDGTTVDVDVVMSRVRPRKGRARFAILMVEDITARKRAQAELIQAEKLALTGRLAASMAHEINNPLQSVIGCLGLAQEVIADGEDPAAYMQVAMDELDRAARIVYQLRELNRPQEFRKEPTDVNDLVERTLLLTQKRCQNRQVGVTRDLAPNLPLVALAPDRVQQILLNLVLNAVDAMPEGGTLRIRTQRTAAQPGVEIAVADTGEGIPPDRLASLFEPFQSTKEVGMGMGLYVSREIIEEHEGRIDVQSEVERGTTFTIWLPETKERQP